MSMTITRKDVANKLQGYLQHRLTLGELVDWAERVMTEADFEDQYYDMLRDTTARLGLADVRNFGLTWEDCQEFLQALGYETRIKITPRQVVSRVGDKTTKYKRKNK